VLSKEAMNDLSHIIHQLEDTIRIAETGNIPIDVPGNPQLTPFVVGQLLELTRQISYHVKQLQLEVTSLGQQLLDLRNGTRS
jgi:hypothetical protein